jgi:hypothetical protein
MKSWDGGPGARAGVSIEDVAEAVPLPGVESEVIGGRIFSGVGLSG